MQPTNEYTHIDTNTTTDISGSAQAKRMTLVSITVNTTAAGTTTVYDEETGGTTNVVAVLPSNAVVGTYYYNCTLKNGLQVVTGHADQDITVVWRAN